MREHLLGRADVARVKRSELGIFGARLVEPHFIDNVFQKFGIAGPERNAPLPVIEADTHGYQLGLSLIHI